MARIKADKLHQKADPSAQGNTGASSDPIVTRLANADKVPWYKKPNLRYLYFMLFPTCMGIEITSGFDSQMINAVQIVDAWKEFFNHPTCALQGIIGSMYSLGAICSLPFVPIINDRLGRRWAIFIGSWCTYFPVHPNDMRSRCIY